MKKYFLAALILSANIPAVSQSVTRTYCYEKSFSPKDHVFTKMEIYPHYKGHEDKLNLYFANEIDLQKIGNPLPDSIRIFEDTVKVKFIISREGKMSDLSVSANNAKVRDEFERALIKSSCNWVPGFSNRDLNGWYTARIFFKLDRRGNFLSVSITTQRI